MTVEGQKLVAGALLILRACLRLVLALLVTALVLFGTAGRIDWPMAWAYLGFSALGMSATLAYLVVKDPALLAERFRGFKGTRSWDRLLAPLAAVVAPLALLIVAGLDRRFGWTPPFAPVVPLAAFAALVAGYGLVLRAMACNTFFSASVRIQSERGHRVVDTGPYGVVRHPGYAGAIVADLALALVLGSLWALLPAVIAVALLIVRTVLEDRMLQAELDGYRDYARRVPYRLVPGLW